MCYGGFYGFEKELCEKEWFGKGVAVPFEDFPLLSPAITMLILLVFIMTI